MKTKARDIIPGWPRGRSTTPAPRIEDEPHFDLYFYSWDSVDMLQRQIEEDGNREYHERQNELIYIIGGDLGYYLRMFDRIFAYARLQKFFIGVSSLRDIEDLVETGPSSRFVDFPLSPSAS